MPDFNRFRRFATLVLICTLAVIVWGGYVRATGSGAGCGNHWPTCNGEIIPRSPGAETVVEFTHRATSGIAFLMVVAQWIWSLRLFPRRHEVRRATALVLVLMVVEALVGAGLVIFEMVAGNTEIARAYWMAAHLLNTFALLGSMALVSERATRAVDNQRAGALAATRSKGASAALRGTTVARLLDAGLAAIIVVAMTGAIVALGDTLFPSRSLAEGMAQDFSPTAHLFVRLRFVHPVAAALTGLFLLVFSAWLAARDPEALRIRRAASLVAGLVLAQVLIGVANLVLLAPTSLQLIHLLVADLLWLGLLRLRFALHASALATVSTPAAAGLARA
ncbi:MAG TPA: COX15/CtaA family protein [Polyangia bacterium]